eukprot:14180411-Ditylum_brightwellii.AAC.1
MDHHTDKCYKCINTNNAAGTPTSTKQLGAQKFNGKPKSKSGKKTFIPKYFKCVVMGHLSSNCPNNNTNNN